MSKFDLSVLNEKPKTNLNTDLRVATNKSSIITGVSSALSPGIILELISTIPKILDKWCEVRIEAEKTKQIKYQTQAFIQYQKETTKQFAISEKEATKRYLKDIERDIRENNNQTKEELKNIEASMVSGKNAHEQKMIVLKMLENLLVVNCNERSALFARSDENHDIEIRDRLDSIGKEIKDILNKL